MKRAVLTALSGLVIIAFAAQAQDKPSRAVDPAAAASARKVLTATGATRLMLGNLESMIASQRQSSPQIPAAFWDAFLAHARRDTTQLIDMLVRIYTSPIGQRLTAAQPTIFKESMAAGETWGEQIARMVGDSLQKAQGTPPQ